MPKKNFDNLKNQKSELNNRTGNLGTDEFLPGVTDEFSPEQLSGMSRRKFIALMSASTAFAATACTDYQDKGEIIPYTNRPEGVLPGKANYYASTCNGCTQHCGVLVKTREGRPIKVDGNLDNPINKGKLCSAGQASILNLYDPDRLKHPTINNKESNWEKAFSEIGERLDESHKKGNEIPIICGELKSNAQLKLLEDFKKKYPTTTIYSYSLFNNSSKIAAWKECYGNSNIPSIKLEEAKIILALESDFLGRDTNNVENIKKYSKTRDVAKPQNISRLYCVEGGMSLTGMNSDYRLRLRPDVQEDFVLALINDLLQNRNINVSRISNEIIKQASKLKLTDFAKKYKLDSIKLNYLVTDIINNLGSTIVVAGNTLPKNVHVLVNSLNEIINASNLYDYSNLYTNIFPINELKDFSNLVQKLSRKEVDVVLHFDSNPAYTLPSTLNYSKNLKNVETVISLSEIENETTALSNYILPINHYLESWGCFEVKEGIHSLQQPVIAPIYNTLQKEDVLLKFISEKNYQNYLKDYIRKNVYLKGNYSVDYDSFWFAGLHDGIITSDQKTKENTKINTSLSIEKSPLSSNGFMISLKNNYTIGETKFANNGWLHETPHPVSKITWDNYAAISPSDAEKLGVKNDDLIKISSNNNTITVPVLLQPGVAENVIEIETGYGRRNSGKVAEEVGVNANVLIASKSFNTPFIVNDIKIQKTEDTYKLVSTQEHHSLEDDFVKDIHIKRNIIQELTVDEFIKEPKKLHHKKHETFSITEEHKYEGLKWGMSIDLNKCIGCSACVTSCNVENNVPVVGKDQVEVGREMQWMRIDRYYSGTSDDPIISNQPMLCQHCDNAPCENVCPVSATNHSPDGLNQMAYNRCVGTRYCANNCSYKVRRFNFYDFRDHFRDSFYNNEVTPLVNNPEVTVRSRGVMEKCTFCIQRIMDARSNAIADGRELKGDDVTTACQNSCPADAIVFGDVNDSESEVSKQRNHDLGYHVLEELNIKPNVTYIAKLRNTHSEEI